MRQRYSTTCRRRLLSTSSPNRSIRALAAVAVGVLACTAAAAALSPTSSPSLEPVAQLSITMTGLKSLAGVIMVAVFENEAAYLDGNAPLRGIRIDARLGELRVQLPGLPTGRYAIKAYHDLNANGKLDTNLFGVPLEPVAFSNNAPVHLGPPSWADASFILQPGDNVQTILID